MNVIPADFSPSYQDEIYLFIKHNGVKNAQAALIGAGFHPSFVKAIVKKIMRTRGW